MNNYQSFVNPIDTQKRIEEMQRLSNQEETKQRMEKEKYDIEREIKFANMRAVNEEN